MLSPKFWQKFQALLYMITFWKYQRGLTNTKNLATMQLISAWTINKRRKEEIENSEINECKQRLVMTFLLLTFRSFIDNQFQWLKLDTTPVKRWSIRYFIDTCWIESNIFMHKCLKSILESYTTLKHTIWLDTNILLLEITLVIV